MATHNEMTKHAKKILESVEACRAQLAEVPPSYMTGAIEHLAEAVEALVLNDQPLWNKVIE